MSVLDERVAAAGKERAMAMILQGESEQGKPRELVVRRDGDRVYLWIRTPGSEQSGYSIYVSTDELLKLLRAGS